MHFDFTGIFMYGMNVMSCRNQIHVFSYFGSTRKGRLLLPNVMAFPIFTAGWHSCNLLYRDRKWTETKNTNDSRFQNKNYYEDLFDYSHNTLYLMDLYYIRERVCWHTSMQSLSYDKLCGSKKKITSIQNHVQWHDQVGPLTKLFLGLGASCIPPPPHFF